MCSQETAASSRRRRSRAEAVRTRKTKQTKFLNALLLEGTISGAVHKTGIDRHAHDEWMEMDSDYVSRFGHANEELADELEAEVRRRALQGTVEPLLRKGEQIGSVRRPSDRLLELLWRTKRPDLFRNNARVEVDGLFGEIDTSNLNKDEIETLRTLVGKIIHSEEVKS